ncbi:MAG: bifunctional YncE family protein/alkaline phosphatase family protein [Solirubrobacteraceae bacterium]
MADDAATGVIGPNVAGGAITANGRQLHPYGRLTTVGNVPTGGAVTPDGHFYWTISTGRGRNDVRIVDVASGAVLQTLTLPGAEGGIVMDPTRPLAYVSGTPNSPIADEHTPSGAPGQNGDVIHVFRYDQLSGQASEQSPIALPPPPDAPTPQNFPPTNKQKFSWPAHLAISPDGSTLLVPLNLADQAAIITLATNNVRYVPTGSYPYGAAILAGGKTGLVSNETPGTVSVIDLVAGTRVNDIQVGGHLSHPEAIVVDPAAPRAYVALANSDQVAVIDTTTRTLAHVISVARPEGIGSAPVALAVTPDGSRLLAAESGADQLAVISLTHTTPPAGPPAAGPPAASGAPNPAPSAPAAQTQSSVVAAPGNTAVSPSSMTVKPRPHRAQKHRRRCRTARTHHHRCAAKRCHTNQRHTHRCVRGRCHTKKRHTHRCSPRHKHHARRHHHASPKHPAGTAVALPLQGTAASRRFSGVRADQPDYLTVGSIPTAAYPADVQVTAGGKLLWTAAKGLGTGPSVPGPNPYGDDGSYAVNYLPDLVKGQVGVADFPSPDVLRSLTASADTQVLPSNPQSAPADTPLRPNGPIKHIFYVVRENRSYDQVLGDVAKGAGDPSLTLFGNSVTPNMHALVNRFGLADHFYSNSEASIDGHFWTSASSVSDYVVKNWNQNYRDNGRPYDFGVFAVTWPGTGFLFDQARREGINYFNYGEAIAGVVPVPDKDRTTEETQLVASKLANSDIGPPQGCYPNDASIGNDAITMAPVFDSDPAQLVPPPAILPTYESRFRCLRARLTTQLVTGTVPAFNYLVLSNDHTLGTRSGAYSPRAMVADNDQGLGQLVDLISHSNIWDSSAIFVLEDDSQNGPDHIDAHRLPVAVISPYTKPAAVVHTRYDMPSMIRSMELIMGMRPLSLFDATATPMYDLFQSAAANGAPYVDEPPTYNLAEKNGPGAPAQATSNRLPLNRTDRVPQQTLDRILWQSVHGAHSTPPPPGPNATPGG